MMLCVESEGFCPSQSSLLRIQIYQLSGNYILLESPDPRMSDFFFAKLPISMHFTHQNSPTNCSFLTFFLQHFLQDTSSRTADFNSFFCSTFHSETRLRFHVGSRGSSYLPGKLLQLGSPKKMRIFSQQVFFCS